MNLSDGCQQKLYMYQSYPQRMGVERSVSRRTDSLPYLQVSSRRIIISKVQYTSTRSDTGIVS